VGVVSEIDQKWYFSIVEVIEVLTESPNPRDYWFKMKIREFRSLAFAQKVEGMEFWMTKCKTNKN
jgi:hypothetical protein